MSWYDTSGAASYRGLLLLGATVMGVIFWGLSARVSTMINHGFGPSWLCIDLDKLMGESACVNIVLGTT